MESTLALHTAARRYLIDRRSGWIAAYSLLPNQGRASDDYHYLDEAKDIFPRYNVLDAIRVEVERLDPDRLPDLDRVADALRHAGRDAQSVFTTGRAGRIERKAMEDERSLFVQWVEGSIRNGVVSTEPLPYRRTLSPDESADWWAKVGARWNVEEHAWWEPIVSPNAWPDVTLINGEACWGDDEDGPATVAVRKALKALGVQRVIELREDLTDYEVDVDTLIPAYNGAEGMFTAEALDWLIFASHEWVTAIGGVLVDPLKSAWPEWEQALWTGSEWV